MDTCRVNSNFTDAEPLAYLTIPDIGRLMAASRAHAVTLWELGFLPPDHSADKEDEGNEEDDTSDNDSSL